MLEWLLQLGTCRRVCLGSKGSSGSRAADHRYSHADQSQSCRLSRTRLGLTARKGASAARCGPIRIAPTAAIGFSAPASCARPAPRSLAGRTFAPVRGSAATSCHRGPLACRDRNQDRDRNCLSSELPGEGNGKRLEASSQLLAKSGTANSPRDARMSASRLLWRHLLPKIAAPDL